MQDSVYSARSRQGQLGNGPGKQPAKWAACQTREE
jgi:hypothetical protein